MKKNKYTNYIIWILLAVLFIIIAFVISRHGFKIKMFKIKKFRIREIKRFILSYGRFSSLIFIIVYSLKPIVFVIPASLLSILAGNIYGPYEAIMLSMISCFFAATLAFFIAKLLGRSFVEKLLKGKALTLDESIEKRGFRVMLLMRLSCIFPYDALSYAGGLTKMKYKDFILGTLIGVFPEMLAYSFMGGSMERPFSLRFVLPIIFIVIIAFIGSYYYKSNNKKH